MALLVKFSIITVFLGSKNRTIRELHVEHSIGSGGGGGNSSLAYPKTTVVALANSICHHQTFHYFEGFFSSGGKKIVWCLRHTILLSFHISVSMSECGVVV